LAQEPFWFKLGTKQPVLIPPVALAAEDAVANR